MRERLLCILTAALILCTQALAEPVNTPPMPTLYPEAAPYETEHPENLDPDQLYCWSAILIEADSGRVIFEKNPDDIRYPASTTKIMTVLLALTMLDNYDFTVTCSETAVAVNNTDDDISSLDLQPGEELSFLDLLYGTMLRSANDGANVIAETVAGSISAFVALMNDAAERFGCTNTHFSNAHGLHDDAHYTTPRDMAIIARVAYENELFRDIVSTSSYNMPRTNMHRARTLNNTNELFRRGTDEKPNRYYYEDATGMKTGFTSMAKYCFVGSAERNDVKLISVVMYSGDNSRWRDTILLMNYGFSQYTSVSPIDLYRENPVSIQTSNYALDDPQSGKLDLNCVATNGVATLASMVVTFDEAEELAADLHDTALFTYTRDFAAPIEAGEVLGTMTYFLSSGDAVIYNLTAARNVSGRADAPKTLEQLTSEAMGSKEIIPRLTAPLVFSLLAILTAVSAIWTLLLSLVRRARRGRKKKGASRVVKEPSE